MSTETMVAEATKRVSQFINRSAGQHLRAMHIDDAFGGDAAACNQIDLDKLAVLYEIGNKYEISMEDSRRLCDVSGISYAKLLTTTECA